MKYVKKGTVIILAALFCLTVLWGRSGLFSFAEDPVIYGDVDGNGKINLQDAQMVLQAALKIKGLEAAAHQAADVSGDRQVTLEDAQLVLKYALRIITAFPVQATDLPEEKPEQPEEGAEILVAYFSKTGTTRAMAEQIQQETGGTLFEIQPVHSYPDSYQETVEIVQKERAEDARPPIANQVEHIQDYSVVFVGFPIWFGDEPCIIRTFLESYDFDGKIVIPFCTSGSSPLGPAQEHVKSLLPNATVLQGLGLSGTVSGSRETIATWVVSCMKQIEELTAGTPESTAKPEETGGSHGDSAAESGNADDDTNKDNNLKPEENTMRIQAGTAIFTAEFADNSSAKAMKELLAKGPLTIEMSDYGNFEKVGPIGTSLPRNDAYITTEPGDIILYQGNSLTIYYDTNSWNFTRVAKIQNITQAELKAVLGSGDVTVTFSLE